MTVLLVGASRCGRPKPYGGIYDCYDFNLFPWKEVRLITTKLVQLFYDVDPAFVPPNPEFRVIALDSNLVRYMSDSVQSRSGIEGAFGLFGATTSARIAVPWP